MHYYVITAITNHTEYEKNLTFNDIYSPNTLILAYSYLTIYYTTDLYKLYVNYIDVFALNEQFLYPSLPYLHCFIVCCAI